MANGLSGRSAIVTGAARGIGLAIARRLVRAGAVVMMADIDEHRLDVEVEALAEAGYEGRPTAFVGDLRQKLAMANLMAATMDAQEGVHILVNACRLLTPSSPLDPEEDRFDETMAQNVTALLRLSQIVGKRMIELADDEGSERVDRAILNISSVHARRAPPELLAYSVSCAALEQLTRTFALAMAPHGVRVNALAVGGIAGRALQQAVDGEEDLQDALSSDAPLGRTGERKEVADAALFMVSPAASFVLGQVLDVDGGRLLADITMDRLLGAQNDPS